MKLLLKLGAVLLILSAAINCKAQQKVLTNAHSHNDYMQSDPFFHAFNAGFGSIEADIFIVNGKLLVAHDEKSLQAERTLKKMYLDPIQKALEKDTSRRLTLLIDLKQAATLLMPELINELKPLRKYCKGYQPNGRLLILISGERPLPVAYQNYPSYIYFDEILGHLYTGKQLDRVGQISLQFSKYSKWKGVGALGESDEVRIKGAIDSAHALGKPIRFWAAPDNEAGWKKLLQMHVDMLGTDHIDALAAFLKQ